MNIVDKNGRLFGKINIIDLSVVLVLLFAVPVFIFSYKAMVAKEDTQKTWITVNMRVLRAVPELVETIKSNDIEISDSGKKIGILVNIDNAVPSATLVLANDNTRFTLINDPITKDITIELNLLCKDNSGFFYYKNLPVKIGSTMTFSAYKYDITGTIIKVDRKESMLQ